jgi:O-antigen/teichoic acid export membrane protein
MKKQITKLATHPLFAGSMMMILGSNFVNALNYLYHLLMGRFLGPGGYGELAAMLSLIGLVGMLPLSLNLVVIRFTSSSKTEKECLNLIGWLNKQVKIISIVLFLFLIISSPFI